MMQYSNKAIYMVHRVYAYLDLKPPMVVQENSKLKRYIVSSFFFCSFDLRKHVGFEEEEGSDHPTLSAYNKLDARYEYFASMKGCKMSCGRVISM